MHRVVAVTRDGLLVTRGDANPIADLEPTSDGRACADRVVAVVLPTGRARAAVWPRQDVVLDSGANRIRER